MALIVLSGTALCLLEYFNIINIPLFSSILDSITNADSYDIEKNIPETDTTGFVFYQSPEENISQDAGTGVAFIDNEVLVTLTSENYRSQLEGYLSIIGGRIAGEIPELAEYQIVLEKDYNYAEIQNLVAQGYNLGNGWGEVPKEVRQRAEESAHDRWTLLLQMEYGVWATYGFLYFYITKEDLAARRFDRIWLIFQCD